MSPKHKRFAIALSLATAIIFMPCASLSSNATSESEGSSLKFEVNSVVLGNLSQIIRIRNPTSQRMNGGVLYVPLVKNETARHYVLSYNITSEIGQPKILNDDSGNEYAFWDNLAIDKKEEITLEIDYYVLSFGTHYLIDSSTLTDYDKGSDLYRKYTQPEELIQSDNAEIVLEARELAHDVNDTHEEAFKFYSFVVSHVHYVSQKYERGALWALDNATGDCSEYSYLFVALCRAAGIPARIQTGFGFHSFSQNLEDGHMWTEYYLEDYGWVPVDATWNMFDTIDEKHFSSMQGVTECIPYSNYYFNYTSGPEESELDDSQRILLQASPTLADGDFAENASKAVDTISQAGFAVSLGEFLGVSTIFPSEAKEVDQTLFQSRIRLEHALELWGEHPQAAQSEILDAVNYGENAAQKAWKLIAYAFAIFITAFIVILLVTLFFMRRHQGKQGIWSPLQRRTKEATFLM